MKVLLVVFKLTNLALYGIIYEASRQIVANMRGLGGIYS